jgi:hypothetical protein
MYNAIVAKDELIGDSVRPMWDHGISHASQDRESGNYNSTTVEVKYCEDFIFSQPYGDY